MKLIYLIAGTYRPAGMERVLSLKATALREAGDEVVIVTTDQRGQTPAFNLGGFRQIDLGINYELTNGVGFLKKTLAYPLKQLKHRRLLTKVLKAEKADIVVCMFDHDAPFACKIKDGSRKVLEAHFSRYKRLQYERKGLWGLADRIRYRKEADTAAKYDRFVVLTEEDRALWCASEGISGRVRRELAEKIRVIPNMRTFTCESPAALTERKVLAAGRYTHQKGFDMLLKAWEKVNAPGWILRIAGGGDVPEGLPGNVVTGPAADMKTECLGSSVFVLSSRYEGFGMVLVEAQAAGVPMVSFDCKCGPSEIITDGEDGFLVKLGDIDALAARIQQLVDDEELRHRMGAAAFANSARFDRSVIMSKWSALFRELIGKK